MNLIQTMISPIVTLCMMILIPNYKKMLMETMSKMSTTLILLQMIHLHTQTTQNMKQMMLLFVSNSTINTTTLKMQHLCMDTLSTALMLLTTLLIMTSILISKKTMYHTHKSLYMCLFLTTMTLFLTFSTSSLMIFYMMFESSIIPLMIMMALWGSRKEKMRATYYFLLYTIMGSLPLFMTMLSLQHTLNTINTTTLYNTHMTPHTQLKLFMGLFLAFAMKTPLMPWHSWLPLAHVEAPAMGSVLLAGMLLKLGTYGFMRFTIPTLTQMSKYLSPLIMTMSMLSMWLASMNSLRQNDIKRIMAYSSMAHMGMITAACFSLNPMSKTGAIMLMLSHGLTSSALFALMSYLYERHKSRLMKNFRGMSQTTPMLSTLMIITALAHMSTPGSMNFMGEFLCLLGLWELHPSMTIASTIGMVMSTGYMLLLYIQMSGSKTHILTKHKMQDLSLNETQAMLILTMPNMTMGLIPYPLIKWESKKNL